MSRFKIVLSIIFVLIVVFVVARGCLRHDAGPVVRESAMKSPAPVVKKAKPLVPAEPLVSKPEAGPRIAVILDDWGNDFSLVKDAIAIGRPLTLSILPHLPSSRRIAEEAFKHRLGIMLHMPMQPKYQRESLEPHMIFVTMPDPEITGLLERALESVPHAEGVNNHMGSAAVADPRVMKIVLKELKARNLFFVDSVVTPDSAGSWVARQTGIRFAKRNVFLDNDPTPESVKKMMLKAKRIALSKGKAIVIGHDKKLTLAALKEIMPELEKEGVRFVLVRELVSE